ncbi:MAG: endonuclease/exonuclease/phosphatase family protein [Acidobacteriota bacterium]
MRRRLLRIGSILTILFVLLVAYRVLGVYEFRSGECTAVPARTFASTYPKHLVVMSYNIEGHASFLNSEHIAEIARTIRKYNPDIVGLNEVHRNTWQSRFGDHVTELERLTGMKGVFGRSYVFARGEFGNAVLTRGQIVSSEVHDLPGSGEPRTILETVVRVNGGIVEFYATHTTAWASINRSTRDLQLQCINAHVRASRHPFILVGDLNASPDSEEIKKFLDRNVLQLAGDAREPTHKVMEERLDYILTDPGWQVRSARVLDDGPSDHRPIIAELTHP